MGVKLWRTGMRPVELIFITLSLCFGLYFAFASPLLWGIDESTHFLRAYQISQNTVTPPQQNGVYGGNFPVNLIALRELTGHDLVAALPTPTNILQRHDFYGGGKYESLAGQSPQAQKLSLIHI